MFNWVLENPMLIVSSGFLLVGGLSYFCRKDLTSKSLNQYSEPELAYITRKNTKLNENADHYCTWFQKLLHYIQNFNSEDFFYVLIELLRALYT